MMHKRVLTTRLAWLCLAALIIGSNAAYANGSEQGKITSIIPEG